MTSIDPPVCVGLDVPGLTAARDVVDELSGLIRLFKVGYELFYSEGPASVAMVRDAGADVLLDLKVHDIPRTAAAAVRQAHRLGAAFLTVHGLGGRDMLRAAVETSRELGGPRLLAVTLLTSHSDRDLADLGLEGTCRAQVLRLGELAAEEGADGLVASPQEVELLRVAMPSLLLVTPGIRPEGSPPGDHRRIMSPRAAVLAGADILVVARPVVEAPQRAAAAAAIVEEVRGAQAQRETLRAGDVAVSFRDDVEFVEEER